MTYLSIDDGLFRHVTTGDIDGDSDMDIVASGYDNHQLTWWRQDNLNFVEEHFGSNDPHPEVFEVGSAYPNPFNSSASISVSLDQPTHVSLTVFDILGREIMSLVNEEVPSGRHVYSIDGSVLQTGLYFVEAVVSDQQASVQKLILLK